MLPHRNAILAGTHVLLADAEHGQMRSLIDALVNAGSTVTVRCDGLGAYQHALAASPHVILMAVEMPRVDGFAACRLLAADPRTSAIPVIFTAMRNSPGERIEAFEVGGVDYIVKPFEAAEIIARVRIHIRRVNGSRHTEVERPLGHARNGVIVRAAIRHLTHSMDNPPTADKLARLVGTTGKQLSRAFSENLGKSVSGYLREERLRTAQWLLRSTTLTIASIAEELGFSSGANFATSFREHFGMTPSSYRKSDCVNCASTKQTEGEIGWKNWTSHMFEKQGHA